MKSLLQRFTILKDDPRNPPIPSVQIHRSRSRNDHQWTFFHFPHCGIQKPSIVMINKSDLLHLSMWQGRINQDPSLMTSRALKGTSLNMWDRFCLSQTKLVPGPFVQQICHHTWACSQRCGYTTTVSWCCATVPPKAVLSPSSGTRAASVSTLPWAQWAQTLAVPTATISSSISCKRCSTRIQMWCNCCRYNNENTATLFNHIL